MGLSILLEIYNQPTSKELYFNYQERRKKTSVKPTK